MERVAEILKKTLSGGLIHEAELELNECQQQPNFACALVQICANGQFEASVRKQSLICLTALIRTGWETAMGPAEREYVLSTLPIFVANLPIGLITTYVQSVVHMSVFEAANPWVGLPALISEMITKAESIRTGFIMARALCNEIQHVDDAKKAEMDGFMTAFIDGIAAVLSTPDLIVRSLAFECAQGLLLVRATPFETMNQAVMAIVEKSFEVENYVGSEEYFSYALQVLEFSVHFVRAYGAKIGNPGLLGRYFQLVTRLIGREVPQNVRCAIMELLTNVLNIKSLNAGGVEFLTWSFIGDNVGEFVKNVMLPAASLGPNDLAAFEEDQAGFVAEMDKIAGKFEDVWAEASAIMVNLCRHEELTEAARMLACTAVAWYATEGHARSNSGVQIFSAFRLFASVSSRENEFDAKRLSNFFQMSAPLFVCPDPLVRCAAFMLLSKTKYVDAPAPLLNVCITHLEDPCPAVQHYAAVAISKLLKRIDDQGTVRATYGGIVPKLFECYIRLAHEFGTGVDACAEAMVTLVQVFSDEVLPIAAGIAHELLAVVANDGMDIRTSMAALASFDNLVEIIVLSSPARTALGARIFIDSVEALRTVQSIDVFNSLVLPTLHLVHWIPFDLSFWAIAGVIFERVRDDKGDLSLSDMLDILSELLVKDAGFAGRGDLVASICAFVKQYMEASMEKPDAWCELAKVAASLMIRLGRAHPWVVEVFQRTVEMTLHHIANQQMFCDRLGLVAITNVLMLTDMPRLISIVPHDAMNVLTGFWLTIPMFPETVVTAIEVFGSFSANGAMQVQILYCVTSMLCAEILTRRKDDGDDFDEEAEKSTPYIWFDFSETLLKFYAFMKQLQAQCPAIFNGFLERVRMENDEIIQDLEQLPVTAGWYAETKRRM